MEKVARKFNSHEDAESADDEFYASLTPKQRMEILFDMIEEWYGRSPDANERRPPRVHRIVELERS